MAGAIVFARNLFRSMSMKPQLELLEDRLMPTSSPGIPWVFWNGSDYSRPGGTGIHPWINTDTGNMIQDYARSWEGRLTAPVTGSILFRITVDDGAKVVLNGSTILNVTSPGTYVVSASLTGGVVYPIKADFFQSGGTGKCKIEWSYGGNPFEVVPPAYWSYTEADLESIRRRGNQLFPTAKIFLEEDKAAENLGTLRLGPHVLIDNYYLSAVSNLTRIVGTPERELSSPILTGIGDGVRGPYITVLRDDSGLFRAWYETRTDDYDVQHSNFSYSESTDGIEWTPGVRLTLPAVLEFGASVVDTKKVGANRFIWAFHSFDGMKLAASPNGISWSVLNGGNTVLTYSHDISSIAYDPARGEYVATFQEFAPGIVWEDRRRYTLQSRSTDLIHWGTSYKVLTPDPWFEEGQVQFYGMDGYLTRGDLMIGMVKVLRDDLYADNPPIPADAYGIGYTTLAWSRDGVHWVRDREPFFDRNPLPSWDHAHAWIDEQLPVGDEVFLYYGGYEHGHKVNRFEERQIGVVKIDRDRYAGWEAIGTGSFTTPVFRWDAKGLTLNSSGTVQVEVLSAGGSLLASTYVSGDGLDNIAFADLGYLRGQSLRFRFTLSDGSRIYAFGVVGSNVSAGAASLTVSGRVLLDGVPMAGVKVTLTSPDRSITYGTATTGADGSYSFSRERGGIYRLTCLIPSGYIRTNDDSFAFELNDVLSYDFGVALG